jgi:hypothetical protein
MSACTLAPAFAIHLLNARSEQTPRLASAAQQTRIDPSGRL